MFRTVFDSNIFVSSFLDREGLCGELFRMAENKTLQVYYCKEILAEIVKVLGYGRLRKAYHYENNLVENYVKTIPTVCRLITNLPSVKIVRDPTDDSILACAIKAKADYLITRDKDLLVLKQNRKIKIISPEEFISLLKKA